MGYAIFDLLDSFDLRLDFLLHGMATFSVMALFVWNDVPHLVNSMLLMEVCVRERSTSECCLLSVSHLTYHLYRFHPFSLILFDTNTLLPFGVL